jgi:hypothetical protein
MYALEDLLGLFTRHVPAEDVSVLDNIVRSRRFERAYPGLGAELNAALRQDNPQAALAMLGLAERELARHLAAYKAEAVSAVRKFIESTLEHHT